VYVVGYCIIVVVKFLHLLVRVHFISVYVINSIYKECDLKISLFLQSLWFVKL